MPVTIIKTVGGAEHEVWSDYRERCTYAKNTATGETRKISGGGYLRNDLTIRKAIATVFGYSTFRR